MMASTMLPKATRRQNLTKGSLTDCTGNSMPACHPFDVLSPRSASYPVASLYPLIDKVRERLPGNEAASPWRDKQVPVLQHHSALTYDHGGHSSALHSFKDVVLYILGRGPQVQHPSALTPRPASTTGNLLC